MNNDRITELYNGEIGPSESQNRARTRIHWLCAAATGDVLDVGCSQGIASLLLAREGHTVTGVDIEGAALVYARRQQAQEEPHVAERLEFRFAEGGDLPFEDASFDSVLMGELLEHQVDGRPVVAEARRVLREDGTLVITFPYGIFRYPDHKEPLYLESVLALLTDAFSVERIELVERWVGIVARAVPAGRTGLTPDAWAAALGVAEARVAALDTGAETRRETLKRTQQRLEDARRDAAETRARQAAAMRELDLVRTRLRALEAESRQAQRARVEAERGLAVAEGRLQSADEDAERRNRDALAELDAARYRIAFLTRERDDQQRALDDADTRAAGAERRLAVAEVELESARLMTNGAGHLAAYAPASDATGAEWLQRGREARADGDLHAARDAFARALELEPGWDAALWQALWVASRLDRPEDFEALAGRLGPVGTMAGADLEKLAPIALRAGAHGLAQTAGERLLELDPKGETGLLTTAAAQWEQGREAEATAIVDGALADAGRSGLRAAIGFHRHIDDLDPVPELLRRLGDDRLKTEVARQFLRRGQPAIALELLGRGGGELREQARAGLRLYDGTWRRRYEPRELHAEPGRILHLVSHSLPHHTSGGTYRTHHTARAQLAAGLQPEVVTLLDFPWDAGVSGAAPRDEIDGIRYHRLPDAGGADDSAAARLGRNLDALVPLVEELRPAVLHPASDYRNAKLALALGEIFGLPVVYEVRGFPEERRVRRPGSRVTSDQGAGRRILELDCMNAADRIVTLGDVMKAHMASRGVDAEKIRIVPNGVDPGALKPVERDPALAAALGLDGAEAVLGYISTFHSYEGIQFIIRATAELIRRGRRVKALLVGDGNERAALEALAEELGIAGDVVFTGRVPHDEVLAYYGQIDLFVVARRDEETSELVTPLKPFEAMAVERAVIVADLTALREIVRDGETGRTFRPEDSIHLADVAQELIDDPAERARLAAAGRAWVADERTWGANAARYRELYAELGAL